MKGIVALIIWLIISYLIGSSLAGGSSDATTTLTLIIFFGLPIIFFVSAALKSRNPSSNRNNTSKKYISFNPNNDAISQKYDVLVKETLKQKDSILKQIEEKKQEIKKAYRDHCKKCLFIYGIFDKKYLERIHVIEKEIEQLNSQNKDIRFNLDIESPDSLREFEYHYEIWLNSSSFENTSEPIVNRNYVLLPDLIACRVKPVTINIDNTLYFYIYPKIIMVFRNSEYIYALKLTSMKISVQSTIEHMTGQRPSDTRITGSQWLYQRKDGNPDRRYKNNYKIYTAEFAQTIINIAGFILNIKSSSLRKAQSLMSYFKVMQRRENEELAEQKTEERTSNLHIAYAKNDKSVENKISDELATYIIEEAPAVSKYKSIAIIQNSEKVVYPYTKFVEMRELVELGSTSSKETRFIKQAHYMEDFEDTYDEPALFQCYYPTYDSMNDEQLRTYFSWRTEVRKGEVEHTSLSYVFLYIYELINNIGVKDCLDAMSKIIFVWNNYKVYNSALDKYMIRWIKDYFICEDFSISFKEFIDYNSLKKYYPEAFFVETSHNNCLEKYNEVSNYKIIDSRFYSNDTKDKINSCFVEVLAYISDYFKQNNFDIEQLILGEIPKLDLWHPFNGAVYVAKNTDSNKRIEISSKEVYEFTDGKMVGVSLLSNVQ